MKIYIKSSTTTSVFKTNTTGMSFYDDFLNPKDLEYMQKQKNLTGEIVMMSPNEYFQECADRIFTNGHTVEDLKHQREASTEKGGGRTIDKYKDMMANGTKFDMCMLNYAQHSQEGLHRMYAAGELLGWDTKFPVLVVTHYDEERAREQALLDDAKSFIKYYFKYVCDLAKDHLADEYYDIAEVPSNATELFKAEIIKCAKQSGYEWEPCNIDVLIEIHMDGDYVGYACWVSEYNGLKLDMNYKNEYYPDYTTYENDVFWIMPSDTSGSDSDLSDGVDLDDLDMPFDEWMAKHFGV